MYTNDELRRALNQPQLTDKECDEFRRQLDVFLNTVLDAYFRDTYGFDPDELAEW